MPNMFGGDQHHPAYDPTTPVGDNQALVNNTLYTINDTGENMFFTSEEVNGNSRRIDFDSLPKKLQAKALELGYKG